MSKARNFWTIPTCAWHRPLGDIPAATADVQINGDIFASKNRSKKGMPLGGIGAGNFMYNLCGTFGPWHMKAGHYEERFLSQAAFHFREQIGHEQPITKTLATGDVLPAWDHLESGDGDYYALFPRGWCTYKPFKTDVSLQFFSPIIKDNYQETSYPAAVFLFHLANTELKPATVSVMFTFPNAPYTGPMNLNVDDPAAKAYALRDFFVNVMPMHERERKGLQNKHISESATNMSAILMTADDPDNPVETQGSSWCVATTSEATFVTSWDGAGDGGDIWADFSTDGQLRNGSLTEDTALPSAALACQVTLEPGQETVIPFVLAWDFQFIEFGAGTRWLRRHTEYFPTDSTNALDVARSGLANHREWLKAVETWVTPIIKSPAYPDWLKQGALNELYYVTFGGSFWENGCVTKPKAFGNRPGQHLQFVMECMEYPFAETFDVRHHAARTTRDLWPQIERDILLADADFIMDTPDGSAPHDAGSPHADPYFAYDNYFTLISSLMSSPDMNVEIGAGTDRSRKTTPWSEFSPKFIQQSYAYWHKTGDDAFLDEIWEAALRTFHYQISTDTDGDGVTEMMSSEYADNKFFNAVLWIGALQMMEVMAAKKDDQVIQNLAAEQLVKARNTAEKFFWNQELGFYQFNTSSTDIMGDAFVGQRYVDTTGLPPTLTPDRITSHYRQAFRISSLLLDTDGDGIGNLGMGNVLSPEGKPGTVDSIARHQEEVWTGVSYLLAANMAHWGKRIQDGALQAAALMLAWGVHQQTWHNDATGYWFNTPEAWDIDDPTKARAPMYQRARGIWELLMEIHDPF